MWVLLCACLALYVLACVFYHKCVRHTGEPVRVSYPLPDGRTITFTALSGDLGTPLVVREVLQEEVYFKHGVDLPACDLPHARAPLVVDIGCNIGLFALAVHRRQPEAIVVGAEPIDVLSHLAVANTADLAPRVVIVPVGVGQREAQRVPFVFDPHLSAGASMYAATIARPFHCRPWHAQLLAVLRDNAEAGNLPAAPTHWLCAGLQRRHLRWPVMLAALPVLLLLCLYLLVGGHHRRVVYGSITTLGGVLARAADSACSAAVSACIRGNGPIDLLKVDVEGAEMDVLLGITSAEWTRIQQTVMEVHDIDHRVEHVCDLLRTHGFQHIVVDVESWVSHELLCIRSVYARRLAPSTP